MSDEDLSGRVLGDFQILRRVGRGAMGVVYEATERSLRRTVAIKVMPDEVTRDAARRGRFLREARAAAAVHHPCVATIFQVGSSTLDGDQREVLYIAMELVRGPSLRDRLAQGRLPVDEAVRIAIDVARGLGRAHESGVVHRDVKPDNVMLTHGGDVKILDFGVARFDAPTLPDATQTGNEVHTGEGRIFGSPGYMAPEQARGGPIDGRSDLFSLGVVLYELLTGTRPFGGATTMDMIIAAARDPHRPVGELRGDVPRELAVVIDRCLAKEPGDRYATAEALVAALRGESGAAVATPLPIDPLALPTLSGVLTPDPTATPVPSPATITGAPGSAPDVVPRRSRLGLVVGLGAFIAAGVIVALVVSGSEATVSSPTSASPTNASADAEVLDALAVGAADAAPAIALPPPLEDGGVLACPILEVAGAEAPSGWLGAAAAELVCARATIMLGGRVERTRVPAELLDLPTEPIDEFPLDPFSAADARERSLVAARARASAWIDGKVTQSPNGFTVELVMVRAAARSALVQGDGRALYQAVRAAMDELVRTGELHVADRLDADVARWKGFGDVDLALDLSNYEAGLTTGFGTREALAKLEASKDRLGLRWAIIARSAWIDSPDAPPPPAYEPPPADPSASAPTRMYKALLRAAYEAGADRKALADELAALRAETTEPEGIIALTNAEATLRNAAGDVERARQLLLQIVARAPRQIDWVLLSDTAMMTMSLAPINVAQSAWHPQEANSWYGLTYTPLEPEVVDRMQRRAITLGPGMAAWSCQNAFSLIMAGKPVRARTIAAHMAELGPTQATAAAAILAFADASEGRFAAALARVEKALSEQEVVGRIMTSERELLGVGFLASSIIGTRERLADAFATRFVTIDTNRIIPSPFTVGWLSNACAYASPEVARACLQRLRKLSEEGYFVQSGEAFSQASLESAERFVAGDYPGCVAAARALFGAPWQPDYLAVAFEEAGDLAMASAYDARQMARAIGAHGATLAHVREARRACARKDWARCKQLAQTVIDAWMVADTHVPSVDAMRALIATIPK